MFVSLIVALVLAAVCGAGWLSAECDLRRAWRDLDVALGWEEQSARSPVVLHAIEGGEEA